MDYETCETCEGSKKHDNGLAPCPDCDGRGEIKKHWTKKLQEENSALRVALSALLWDDLQVAESRLAKEAACPSSPDYALGYVTCAREVDLRIRENRSAALDRLAEAGIRLD